MLYSVKRNLAGNIRAEWSSREGVGIVVDPAGRVVGASFGAKNWNDPAAEKLVRSLMPPQKK